MLEQRGKSDLHFRTVGRPLVREDGLGKVTGSAHYTADVARADAPGAVAALEARRRARAA